MKLLRDRRLAALLAAEVISSTGTQMTWVALPWFVLRTTGSPQRMSWVLIAEIVPIALLGFWGGAIASRVGTRRTMLVCDLARAPLFAAIPFLHARGALPFWALIAFVATSGIFLTPYGAVQRSVIPEIVGEEQGDVASATALTQAANRFTIFAGPTVAGVLIAIVGASNVLYVDAATYVASFVLVALFVHVPRIELPEDAHGALAGARFVVRDRLLRIWFPSFTLLDVCWTVFFACLPVLVVTKYGHDSRIYGYLIGALGGGALVGAVAALHVVRKIEPLLLVGCAFLGQMTSLWGSIVPGPWLIPATAMACAGFFMSMVNSPLHAFLVLRTPRDLRVQTMAFSAVMQAVGAPIGLAVGGVVLGHFATRHVITGVLALQTCAVIAIVTVALSERSALRAVAVDSPA